MFLLSAVQFTHIMDFVIMMPLGPQLMRVFAISPSQFGFLVSAYTFAASVSGFISAFFIDRLDRKTAMVALYGGFAISTLGCAVAPTFGLLLTARVVAGFFGGVLSALVLAIIGDAVPEHRRGRATGKVMAAFSVASVAGIPVGLFLASKTSWHAPFFMLAAMSFLVLVALWQFLPSMRGHLSRVKAQPLTILKGFAADRNLLLALALMVVLTFSSFLVIPFMSPYMVANVGFAELDLSYIYFFGGLATVVTSQWAGRLADRFGKARVFAISALLLILPTLAITNLPPVTKVVAFTVTTIFFIFNGARFVPAMAMVTSSVQPQQRGSFMSFSSAVQNLASGAASFVGGLVIQKSLSGQLHHFWVLGIAASVGSLVCVLISRYLKVVS